MSVKPEDDFQGYMEGMEERAAQAADHQAMVDAHMLWKETTWSGWAVTQLQSLGHHFGPFFTALSDMMNDTSDTSNPQGLAVLIAVRILVLAVAIAIFYLGAYLVQMIIGREFVVMEEEIIYMGDGDEQEDYGDDDGDQYTDDDVDSNDGGGQEKNFKRRRNKRGKKKKN